MKEGLSYHDSKSKVHERLINVSIRELKKYYKQYQKTYSNLEETLYLISDQNQSS